MRSFKSKSRSRTLGFVVFSTSSCNYVFNSFPPSTQVNGSLVGDVHTDIRAVAVEQVVEEREVFEVGVVEAPASQCGNKSLLSSEPPTILF